MMEHIDTDRAIIFRLEERICLLENELKKFGSVEGILKQIDKIDQQMFINKEIFSFEEACAFLDASRSQIYKLTRLSDIPHYQPQRKIYFLRSELIEWIKKHPAKNKKYHIKED